MRTVIIFIIAYFAGWGLSDFIDTMKILWKRRRR